MNLFQDFAYKKKPSVITISESSDDEVENGSVVSVNDKEEASLVVSTDESSSQQDDNEDNEKFQEESSQEKRKFVVLDESSEEDNENSNTSAATQQLKRKRIQQISSDESEVDDGEKNDDIVVVNQVTGNANQPSNVNQTFLDNETFFKFLNKCKVEELMMIQGITLNKATQIVDLQPFPDIETMIEKMNSLKHFKLSMLFDGYQDFLWNEKKLSKFIEKCEAISEAIQLEMNTDMLPIKQPLCIDESLSLKRYQLVGLNWLAMLHEKDLNGILADEMGLGKTIQTLSFLGYLLENGFDGPHLILCPCSTLDNWIREFEKWLPNVAFTIYRGSIPERVQLRREINEDLCHVGVIITTLDMLTSTKFDRNFFYKLELHYLIVDEAHVIKNLKSKRFQYLQRLNARRKVLLTGTPLQNDVGELMALLMFLMPEMFNEADDSLKSLLLSSKSSNHGKEQLEKLKKILQPFILRRLKNDVLSDLSQKIRKTLVCEMEENQKLLYSNMMKDGRTEKCNIVMLMNLRKASNHQMLLRQWYDDEKLRKMSELYVKNPFHFDCDPHIVYEDMEVMSDFELNNLCEREIYLKDFKLENDSFVKSGKLNSLDQLLPILYNQGDRVVIFSQFVTMLDILERYMKVRKHSFVRFDGSTKGFERQQIIDKFNNDESIFIFLLSTKAGGLGVNLTSANTVIIHDIDFNPYNDRQAEDRCHRVGQKKDVTVYKMVSKDTVEEWMLKCGERKLELEKELVGSHSEDISNETSKSVLKMLADSFPVPAG